MRMKMKNKKMIVTATAVMLTATAVAKPPLTYTDSLDAMILAVGYVESLNNPNAIGDNGAAVGFLQITEIMVKEANRLAGLELFTLDDRKDSMATVLMFTHIFTQRLNGDLDPKAVAHLWNPKAPRRYREDIAKMFNYYLYVFSTYGK